MAYILTLDFSIITVEDPRNPEPIDGISAGLSKLSVNMNQQMDMHAEYTGDDTGCANLREEIASSRYDEYVTLGGEKLFSDWRFEIEAGRSSKDIMTSENFSLLGHIPLPDGSKKWVGGALIYDVQIIGLVDDAVLYKAACGPVFDNPIHSAMFMRAALENDWPAVTGDDNREINVRLVEWKFPIEDERNRWLMSIPDTDIYLEEWGGLDITVETRDIDTFITSVKLNG